MLFFEQALCQSVRSTGSDHLNKLQKRAVGILEAEKSRVAGF
jgi:hypothetical protein